jgi:hypothetical protein
MLQKNLIPQNTAEESTDRPELLLNSTLALYLSLYL